MTAIGFVSGLMGGIGIGAVIPLFSFVINKNAPGASDKVSEIFSRNVQPCLFFRANNSSLGSSAALPEARARSILSKSPSQGG